MKRKYYNHGDYQAVLKDGTCIGISHITKKYAYVSDNDGNVVKKINLEDIKEIIWLL